MGQEEFLVVEMKKYLKNTMIINYVSIKMGFFTNVDSPSGIVSLAWRKKKMKWEILFIGKTEATRAWNVDSFVLLKKVFLWEGRYICEPFLGHWVGLRAELGL